MRPVRHLLALALPVACGPIFALGAACTASSEDVKPPDTELYFPTGAAIAPDESVLFVANANSELRFDSGSISVFQLADIDTVVEGWLAGTLESGCRQDSDYTETMVCPTSRFLDATRDVGARLGNFATEIAVQELGGGALRLIVPTRGDPSVGWIDWDGSRLSCSASTEGNALCDDDHRLSFALNDADLNPLPNEPFGVFADSAGEFAMVTHLTSGAVTLIDSPTPSSGRNGGKAQITDIVADVFQPDPSSGLRGSTGIAGRTPNLLNDIVYVGSRSEDRVQTFTVGRPINGAPPFLLRGNWFFLDAVGGNNGNSNDTRGMAFSPTGDRLYLVNRKPPSLQVFDTSLGPTGFPRNTAVGAAEICRQASTVVVADTGDGERAYVTCFQDGQLYIVNPAGQVHTEDIITVGRGPYSVVAARSRKKLFVTNFLEDTISVIDVAPGSPTRNRVVLRIGEPRPQ